MVHFCFNVVISALCLALFLINEVESELATLVDGNPILTFFSILNLAIFAAQPPAIIGDTKLKFVREDVAMAHLIAGYKKYSNEKEAVYSSCQVLARLNRNAVRNCDTDFGITISRDRKTGRLNIFGSESKSALGYFDLLRSKDCNSKMKGLAPRQGFKFLEYAGDRIIISNGDDSPRSYRVSTTFIGLVKIMQKRDPFKKLATLVKRRSLKIEVAIEDDVEGKYIIYYNDFQRSDTIKANKYFNFSFNGKKMGYYSFPLDEKKQGTKGLLIQQVIINRAMYLVWDPRDQRYHLKRVSRKNDKWFLLSKRMRPKPIRARSNRKKKQ